MPAGRVLVTPDGPPVIVTTDGPSLGPGALGEPRYTVKGSPFTVVTMPLPHTCIGPLELGPKNIVIGVPFTVVGTPEPHKGVAAGEMLGAGALLGGGLLGHGHGVLEGCWPALGTGLLLPPSKDEIIPGIARTPEVEDVVTRAVEFVGGHGQEHIELVEGGAGAEAGCTNEGADVHAGHDA